MDTADDAVVEDFLKHFGIKGMKWGVRKSPEKAARAIAKQDLAFEKASRNPQTHLNLWAQSVKELRKSGDLAAINNRPEFAKSKFRLRLGVANRPLQEKYEDVVAGAVLNRIKKNARQIVNRSGTRRFDIDTAYRLSKDHTGAKVIRASKAQWRIVTTDIRQADDGSLLITVVRDDAGRIIDLIPEDVSLEQSDLVGPFMEHFGIKGMKWGVRKKRPLSTDAKAKQAVKDKVRQDKVGAISNLKLQQAIRRMQLEQDYKRLSINEKSGITRWLSSTLSEIGKREVQAYAAKKLTVAALKKVATAGVA